MKDEAKRWLDIAEGIIPMAKKPISKSITDFVNLLRPECSVDRVILFGSSITKSRRPDSDLDLLVVSKDFRRLDEDRRLDLLYRYSRFLKPEIHPWGITPEELKAASRLTTIGFARDHGQIVYSKHQ